MSNRTHVIGTYRYIKVKITFFPNNSPGGCNPPYNRKLRVGPKIWRLWNAPGTGGGAAFVMPHPPAFHMYFY